MGASTEITGVTEITEITEITSDSPERAGRPDRTPDQLHAAVDALLTDVAQCGFSQLDVLRGASQRLRSFVAAADARIARRSEELASRLDGGHGSHGGPDDAGPLGGAGPPGAGGGEPPGGSSGGPSASTFGGVTDRRNGSEAEHDHRRGRAGAVMPRFEAALEAGRIDVAHLDAVAAALGRIDDEAVRADFVAHEDQLLAHAMVERPDRFRRRCQDLARRLLRDHGIALAARQRRSACARRWWDRRSGMFHLHLELEPELGAKVETAIDQHLAAVRDRGTGESFQRLHVEAVTELITGARALGARAPEVVVLVDADTLREGVLAAGGVCETQSGGELPVEAVRRMACDAGVVPVVLGGDGVPLDVGRAERLATTAQRRALRAMYRTCAHPDCDRPFSWCRIHHLVFWDDGGETNLDVLLPLCERHHHQVHEGGWSLTMTPDRVCTWRTPDGQVWFRGDTRDALPPDHPAAADHAAPGGPGGPAADPGAATGAHRSASATTSGPVVGADADGQPSAGVDGGRRSPGPAAPALFAVTRPGRPRPPCSR